MFYEEHRESVFNETFQITYDDMVDKYVNDSRYTLEYLKDYLESMYIYAGQDASGRGELKHLRNSAVITALETVLDQIRSGEIIKKEPKAV